MKYDNPVLIYICISYWLSFLWHESIGISLSVIRRKVSSGLAFASCKTGNLEGKKAENFNPENKLSKWISIACAIGCNIKKK